jgi:hypothetical protein
MLLLLLQRFRLPYQLPFQVGFFSSSFFSGSSSNLQQQQLISFLFPASLRLMIL